MEDNKSSRVHKDSIELHRQSAERNKPLMGLTVIYQELSMIVESVEVSVQGRVVVLKDPSTNELRTLKDEELDTVLLSLNEVINIL